MVMIRRALDSVSHIVLMSDRGCCCSETDGIFVGLGRPVVNVFCFILLQQATGSHARAICVSISHKSSTHPASHGPLDRRKSVPPWTLGGVGVSRC
jgi:hypothetical protein